MNIKYCFNIHKLFYDTSTVNMTNNLKLLYKLVVAKLRLIIIVTVNHDVYKVNY